MATHSSILALRIPWTEEPGGLQSMGLQIVGHDWVNKHMGYSETRNLVCDAHEKWKLISRVRLFPTPWTTSPQNYPGQNTGVGSLSFSRGSSQPRNWTQVSRIAGIFFTAEPQGKPCDAHVSCQIYYENKGDLSMEGNGNEPEN